MGCGQDGIGQDVARTLDMPVVSSGLPNWNENQLISCWLTVRPHTVTVIVTVTVTNTITITIPLVNGP
ncbi:GL20415 [Drosophila persimilis]|uniref:GL20415 n=1 Tax=Drosophila persimilis TaxID=7234 RepID=B4GY49_DROPE|nr:GL20415 [Drosophila persimilis]